ncbi:hypothetical protein SHJG_6774 [Streptomyces hygroscopicus subsp. jinggangensis 5008]|nr:hypothetical protein SHJG_6774 [Streptomyces hygroscopicus subsp. jinggangensis 5008]AGF66197.1 hypothetical protein SHJGH_6534 [Streptomyces hygroscopicus subsp. jinggangensis TL01]
MVHVPHEPGLRLAGKPLSSLIGPGLPQLRPFGGVLFGGGWCVGGGDGTATRRHGRAQCGHQSAQEGGAVAAPELTPVADLSEQREDRTEHQPRVQPRCGPAHLAGFALHPGIRREHVPRPLPEAAEIAVPQQRTQQPSAQKGDHGPTEQLPRGCLLRFDLRPGPIAESPDSRCRLRPGGAQPRQEGRPVGHRRHPGRHGRRPPQPLRRRHGPR